MKKERIGFVSTRFAGTDGVSLESNKWADVLKEDGHEVFWYAGRHDRPEAISMCVPEAHFGHHEIEWINSYIWGHTKRPYNVSQRIRDMAEYLKETLYYFVEKFDLSLLIFQNALTIPMNLPLGVAITEFLLETDIPGVAHHHDFYWERSRFMVNAVNDYLAMAFPPRDHELTHVVINKNACDDLAWRKGVASTLIPNVLEYETPPEELESDDYADDIRQELGLSDDDILFLQPTRIVPRKGIEQAIELISMLNDERCKLVISHEAGDEGYEYEFMLKKLADRSKVDVRFVSDRIADTRQRNEMGEKIYTLWDLYPEADFVTYPSIYEGFGNAFLEAIYFKLPLLVNRYEIFLRDIEPKGFKVITMDGYITPDVVEKVQYLLETPSARKDVTEHNYQLAKQYYGYDILRKKLRFIINNIRGE